MIRSIKVQEDNPLDISNEEIKMMVERSGVKLPNIDQIKQDQLQKKRKAKDSENYLMQIGKRKWMSKHGRRFLINFDEKERKDMKKYFQALDQKNNGSIGIEQMEELLISVGLATSREEVKRLIDTVDEDRSGKIEFQQFLEMIQCESEGQNQDLISFFKKVISGRLDPEIPQNLSFQLMVSNIRRKKMMAALSLNNSTPKQVKEGMKVLESYRVMNEKRAIRRIREEQRRKG